MLGEADCVINVKTAREQLFSDTKKLEAIADNQEAVPVGLRDEILKSWRRSHRLGATPAPEHIPFDPEVDRPARLLRAAGPVLVHLADQLCGVRAAILLADAKGLITKREASEKPLLAALDKIRVAPGFLFSEEWTGTNGLGSALEESRPFVVSGSEHFCDDFQDYTCMAAPIFHPMTGAVQGALDITCRQVEAHPLMLPVLHNAVRDIQSRLQEGTSRVERVLLEAYQEISRRASIATIALNQDILIANAAASRLLESSDQPLIWDWASQVLRARVEAGGVFRLACGDDIDVRAQRVEDGGRVAGALVTMRRRRAAARPISARPPAIRPMGAADQQGEEAMPGRSPAILRLQRDINGAVAADSVLITGEDGSGRLFVARQVCLGWRSGAVGSVLQGRKAAAGLQSWIAELHRHVQDGATVVIRHLDSLPDEACEAVELALESGGSRIVATAAIERPSGASRRLRDRFASSLEVPSLRHRSEDIVDIAPVLLARHAQASPVPRLHPSALQILLKLDWPGNVRELEAVLGAALLQCRGPEVTLSHLPPAYRSAPAGRRPTSLQRVEREVILQALADSAGNKLDAARQLGIARSTLYRKMRHYGIDANRVISFGTKEAPTPGGSPNCRGPVRWAGPS